MFSTVADRLARGVQFSDDNLRALINSVGPSDLLKVLPINDVTFLSSPQLARVLSRSQSQAIMEARGAVWSIEKIRDLKTSSFQNMSDTEIEKILKTLFVTDMGEISYWRHALKAGLIDGNYLLSSLSNKQVIVKEKTVLFIDRYTSVTIEAGSEFAIDYGGFAANIASKALDIKLTTGTVMAAVGESSTAQLLINKFKIKSLTTVSISDGKTIVADLKAPAAPTGPAGLGSSIPGADSGGLSKSVTVSAKIHLRNKQ
ncbi:MAG: hypothetical protein HQK49_08080 [Oligoflexia bacterium]|nr:hypothetical protein [Oligoflexia bacterium]